MCLRMQACFVTWLLSGTFIIKKDTITDTIVSIMVSAILPAAGLEPARCHHQQILSLPRLPIPTSRLSNENIIAQRKIFGKLFAKDFYDCC